MASPSANAARFSFKVNGSDPGFRVIGFRGIEGLSRLYRFELELAIKDDDADFSSVLNQPALLTLLGDDDPRYINGVVSRLEESGKQGPFTTYRATLVPKAWSFGLRSNCRIFQKKTLEDIVSQLLDEAGLAGDEYRFSLQGQHPERQYCVQYRESDWNFISRLLEEEGIFYYFEHSEDKHVLVMADNSSIHTAIPGTQEIVYHPAAGQVTDEESIQSFAYAEEVNSDAIRLRDFNFEKPGLNLESDSAADEAKPYELYDYPGRYADPDVGKDLASLRLDALRAMRKVGMGKSNCPRLTSGYLFTVEDHPQDARNIEYLIYEVVHEGRQPQVMEELAGSSDSGYVSQFRCMPSDVPFRPACITPKPTVQGPQTAVVVGPSNEEIYTDKFARVKVQFHWDREGNNDENSSCWIRVSQLWAGAGWGAMHLPRIGQEVIVDFLEGDPDRPIITGRVYHGTNCPPYSLPDEKTKSTIKSDSSPGGGGSNEIRFEDKKGNEEVYLHAQKDLNEVIENDMSTSVGNNQSLTVDKDRTKSIKGNETTTVEGDRQETVNGTETLNIKGNRTETLDADESITIKGNRTEQVSGNEDLTISGNRNGQVSGNEELKVDGDRSGNIGGKDELTVSGDMTVEVTGDYSGKAKKIALEADSEITLTVGSNTIKIDSSGITIEGTMVKSAAQAINEITGATVKLN